MEAIVEMDKNWDWWLITRNPLTTDSKILAARALQECVRRSQRLHAHKVLRKKFNKRFKHLQVHILELF